MCSSYARVTDMDKTTAKERIDFLRAELRENSRRYYVDNAPVISDFEYDALMRELEASFEKNINLDAYEA